MSAGKALYDMSVSAAAYADDILTLATVIGMSIEILPTYYYNGGRVDLAVKMTVEKRYIQDMYVHDSKVSRFY